MGKRISALILLLAVSEVFGQQLPLPPDLRQHNLMPVVPTLISPTLGLEQQSRHHIATWARWQWQTPDGDPTTFLLHYNYKSDRISLGGGFLQNNTNLFQQTGGLVNFALAIPFTDQINLVLGTNIFAYSQVLSDNRFIIQEPVLPFPEDNTDFILQVMPAFSFNISNFSLGMAFENLFDYSFNYRESVTEEKIIMGMARYTFETGGGSAGRPDQLSPMFYIKKIPGFDTQVGINALFAASRYWVQGGYNSFYGPSLGLGGRFFQRFTVGGVLEFPSDNAPEDDGLTYELVASYSFGNIDRRKKVVGFDIEEELEREAELDEARRQAEAEAMQRERDSAEAAREAEATRLAQIRRDSIDAVRQREELLARQRQQDSIEAAERALALEEEEVTPEEGERYQELTQEGVLQPGYYLIANVFGTKRYYEAFMKQLREQGLEPKSFYREINQYNYVYLQRYDSISDARRARDSQFSGRYTGDLWILRIR